MASATLSNLGAENSCRYGLTSSRWHLEEVSIAEISSMAENIPKYGLTSSKWQLQHHHCSKCCLDKLQKVE